MSHNETKERLTDLIVRFNPVISIYDSQARQHASYLAEHLLANGIGKTKREVKREVLDSVKIRLNTVLEALYNQYTPPGANVGFINGVRAMRCEIEVALEKIIKELLEKEC